MLSIFDDYIQLEGGSELSSPPLLEAEHLLFMETLCANFLQTLLVLRDFSQSSKSNPYSFWEL